MEDVEGDWDALLQRNSHAALIVSLIYFPLLAASVFIMVIVMTRGLRFSLQHRVERITTRTGDE